MGSEGPQLIRPSTHLSRLLSLLSPRLCQVCPGLHLQRRLRQVQLLPLKPTPGTGRDPGGDCPVPESKDGICIISCAFYIYIHIHMPKCGDGDVHVKFLDQ